MRITILQAIKNTASAALIAGLVLITPYATARANEPSQSGDAALVIDLINQLRAEYGLAPYTVNATLMAVAQSHADYQASTGTLTHYGANGSRPRDRVIAAGYGPAGTTFVHENIYGGGNGTPYDAVNWWRNSAIHLQGMTQTGIRDIGTGVSRSADGRTYYVALFAMTSGSGQAQATTSEQPAAVPASSAIDPAEVVSAVIVATPDADGALWHTVEQGQAVWHIAAAYNVDVYDLLALNGLTEDNPLIFPGDRLLIQPIPTPTPTRSPTITPEASATAAPSTTTRTPEPSSGEVIEQKNTPEPQKDDTGGRFSESALKRSPGVAAALGIIGGTGVILIATGLIARRKPIRNKNDKSSTAQ
ncbi:MAG: LysM peptidoglycan-binding domain-containing protein [Anaerolineae bacterium]|nr:LysM peptidoglycan-binding domain-containing protein [Anaerolineae bacterium]